MFDYSAKKRDRPKEDDDLPDTMQPNKKLLLDSFTSLKIGNDDATYEPGTVTECAALDTSCMDTDTVSSAVVCLAPSHDVPLQNEHSENVYSMLKNGTRKYGRRVDYLVDELIKKSQRTYGSSASCSDFDLEDIVPSSIGPHPLTDRPLGKLWPTVVPTKEGASMLTLSKSAQYDIKNGTYVNTRYAQDDSSTESGHNSEMEEDDNIDAEHNYVASNVDKKSGSSLFGLDNNRSHSSNAHHAGLITHSDWGIEEVT